ncbi:MAG: membrane protein insertion efficiency factor YidD [Candidatus Andersenbacteria bacterium]|nr:membrane protein insertion efficiency factor YidD [Candidatus Andersenbacteria bacterium]
MTALSFVQSAVKLYQMTLSPDHGLLRPVWRRGVCRFTPSCSEYFLTATAVHGWPGVMLGLRRVLRCHPFARGGCDPVPPAVP